MGQPSAAVGARNMLAKTAGRCMFKLIETRDKSARFQRVKLKNLQTAFQGFRFNFNLRLYKTAISILWVVLIDASRSLLALIMFGRALLVHSCTFRVSVSTFCGHRGTGVIENKDSNG